ncbi:MAG TPA: discoidin domain-containing protein [Polyangia bacterium]|nr:discoidin domain-containing protein [Polyangia bacterium]
MQNGRPPRGSLFALSSLAAIFAAGVVAGSCQTEDADIEVQRGSLLTGTATSSSVENSMLGPANAVDGNMNTRWSSAFSDPQWLRVDLGATKAIGRVVIFWEAAYGKNYQIQVSNDATNWTTIKSVTNGDGGTDDWSGLVGSGRYVRMYGTARATPYGYSIWELQIYPPAGGTDGGAGGAGTGGAGTGGAGTGGAGTGGAGTGGAGTGGAGTGGAGTGGAGTGGAGTGGAGTGGAGTGGAGTGGSGGGLGSGAAIPEITATSSSVETSMLGPANAIDGNMTTRWSSAFSDPQWLTVDFGATYPVGRVVINWEAAYATAYQLQVSNDNATWTTIKAVTAGDGGTDDWTGLIGSGRYLRMNGTKRVTQYGYSIFEIKAYTPLSWSPTSLGRSDTLIDTSWRFNRADVTGAQATTFNDSAWSQVTLPHTWNALDGEDGGSNYYRGIGWYRRHVTVPADTTGRRVYLQFDGSNIVTDVYVNGTQAGEHRGGFGAFRYDVTGLVVAGDNVVAVKVSNASVTDVLPLTADFTFFGGMYRDAHLLIVDPLHIDADDFGSPGVYITPTNVTAASSGLTARVRVTNVGPTDMTADVSVAIRDASGATVTTLTASQSVAVGATSDVTMNTTIANPHLWNGRVDPYLYTAAVTVSRAGVASDADTETFGFRFFSLSASTGFSLNGSYLDLHGVNRHQDRLDKGWAIGKTEHDQDMALITEMGATAIRLAHYEHAQYFYSLCDQNGLVVWAEVPLVNNVTASTAFNNNAQQQLKELIRQSYNHPSIMFWSLSNELADNPDPNPLMTTMQTLAKAEDPSRITTLATNLGDNDPIVAHTDAVGFNKYFGWYGGSYNDFAGWADQIHANFPARKIGVSEWGAGAGPSIHSENPVSQDHSEEYQMLLHEAHWQAMRTRPFLWGKFIWNMFDFAVDSRNEGETPGRNDKGMVTYDRNTKKDVFFFYKANWSSSPVLYITSRRFTTRTPAAITVKVYANTDDVTLTVNGVSLGTKTSTNHIYSWTNVALRTGANVVQAAGNNSGAPYTDSVTWTH